MIEGIVSEQTMKILVMTKRVIDYKVKIRVKSDNSGVETNNVKLSMNPFDEIAVEAAVRLKEAGKADEVVAVTAGTAECRETLRAAMAIGADRGLLVETEEKLQPLVLARLFSRIVEREQPGLVMLGKQSIDGDNNQTGQMLAGLLDWPQGTYISELKLGDNWVRIGREIDGGMEYLRLDLPAVVTTDLRLNEPRYPKLPNIMRAKQKPLDTYSIAEFGIDTACNYRELKVENPAVRSGGIKVETVDELLDKLRNEAKVI